MRAAFLPTSNRAERVLTVILLVLVALLSVTAVLALREPEPFDPIEFDSQRIEAVDDVTGEVRVPTIPGFEGIPAISVEDVVPVVGTRCSSADEVVDVVADLWWSSSSPRGTRFQILEDFTTTVPPGCYPLRFENVIPDEVVRHVLADGDASQWRIHGTVTPLRDGGVPANWQTETFWILP